MLFVGAEVRQRVRAESEQREWYYCCKDDQFTSPAAVVGVGEHVSPHVGE